MASPCASLSPVPSFSQALHTTAGCLRLFSQLEWVAEARLNLLGQGTRTSTTFSLWKPLLTAKLLIIIFMALFLLKLLLLAPQRRPLRAELQPWKHPADLS